MEIRNFGKFRTRQKILKDLNLTRREIDVDSNELVKIIGRIMQEVEFNRGYRNIHQRQIQYGFQIQRVTTTVQLPFVISSAKKFKQLVSLYYEKSDLT